MHVRSRKTESYFIRACLIEAKKEALANSKYIQMSCAGSPNYTAQQHVDDFQRKYKYIY